MFTCAAHLTVEFAAFGRRTPHRPTPKIDNVVGLPVSRPRGRVHPRRCLEQPAGAPPAQAPRRLSHGSCPRPGTMRAEMLDEHPLCWCSSLRPRSAPFDTVPQAAPQAHQSGAQRLAWLGPLRDTRNPRPSSPCNLHEGPRILVPLAAQP